MANRRRNLFILVFVAGLVLASLAVIRAKETKLGLDLSGGTELVYQGRPTPQNPEIEGEDIDRSIEIIRNRTDSLGVAEPEISQIGTDSVRVGLPDVQNADRAIAQVGETAQLFFYDWEPNVVPNPNAPADRQTDSDIPRLYDAVQVASEREPECFEDSCTTTGPTFYLFDARSKQLIAGPEVAQEDLFVDQPNEQQPPNSEIVAVPQGTIIVREEPPSDNPDTEIKENEQTENLGYYVLQDRPELSGDDIRNPEQGTDPNSNQPNVNFEFSDDGREAFEEVTRRIAERGAAQAPPGSAGNPQVAADLSEHFAVVLDREVVSRPIINFVENPAGIDGRTGAQIEGGFNIREAQELAEFLQIGALPIELKLISQSTVSASLGQQALEQGLKAGIAGLIAVVLFLIFFYRLLGGIAALGLLTYASFFYALIELIPITMTLPGIAGLILTIGVAADTNIVIFERIKEEVRAGKSMASAITTGYRKGLTAIIDANVITLITAFILFVLATAGVKGFAFVLGVGTIVSLFTAIVFTQAMLGTLGKSRLMTSPSMLGAGPKRVRWHFDFAGLSKWFFSFSGVILAIGAISFATNQLNLGLDFESGTRISVSLEQDVEVDDVRGVLDRVDIPDAEITAAESEELGPNVFQIQSAIEPERVPEVQTSLDEEFGLSEEGFDTQSIGPTFGEQVARSAIYAVLFSLLVISGYVAFRFEPKFAIPVIIAVIHDLLLTAGIYSLAGREVSSATVAALLTILGYSLYDTVIVFDRIRENLPRLPRATFSQVVNRSLSEVLTRSVLTSLSTAFVILILLVFGGATLKDFAFALLVGISTGAYSSIFIAAPVLIAWKEREPAYTRRRERIEEQMGYVPAFPEDNVIARVEDEGEEPEPDRQPPAEPVPRPPAPSRSAVPGVTAEPTAPVPPGPPEPTAPGADGEGDRSEGREGLGEAPELSEASAEALRRVRAGDRKGGRRGRRKRKHGRPR